jgi:hypothetical protein
MTREALYPDGTAQRVACALAVISILCPLSLSSLSGHGSVKRLVWKERGCSATRAVERKEEVE